MSEGTKDKPFSFRIGDNVLIVKPAKNEPGVSHHMIINNELHRCNFMVDSERKGSLAELVRPKFPKPHCQVRLVCGPPAAGKTTYVRKYASARDIVIDLDDILAEHGGNLAVALTERNRRLGQLYLEPVKRVVWVIVCAPSPSLRGWWQQALGAISVILLNPPRQELYRRVMADPKRRHDGMAMVDAWLAREQEDDPGVVDGACTPDGYPTDPLHPWNR